ncbi:MAG: hypothetical protein ACI9W2_001148 [Gammaproteobacteria bacterium]
MWTNRSDSMSWREQQLPEKEQIFLDHAGFFVHDIEAVGARLEALGFTVQPVSVHYNEGPDGELVRSGTANRLVTFESGYIEVLASVADTPLADQLNASLARYEGLHLIALTHRDVASRDPAFAQAGFAMQPTVELRRNLDTPDGPQQVRATVARCQPGVMPEGRAQMLTHGSPELIWLRGYDSHLNGVNALVEMLVVNDDPMEASQRYAAFSGCPAHARGDFHWVELDRGRLTFISPDVASALLPNFSCPSLPFCAALVLRTPSLERMRAALGNSDIVPLLDSDDLLIVGPEDGVGAYLVIQTRAESDAWGVLQSLRDS